MKLRVHLFLNLMLQVIIVASISAVIVKLIGVETVSNLTDAQHSAIINKMSEQLVQNNSLIKHYEAELGELRAELNSRGTIR